MTVDGIRFDSKREAERYAELKLLLVSGEIADLLVQPRFYLKCGGKDVLIRSKRCPNGRRATWRGDFSYYDKKLVKTVIEDVKGYDTYRSRLKRALVEAEYGVMVEIVR